MPKIKPEYLYGGLALVVALAGLYFAKQNAAASQASASALGSLPTLFQTAALPSSVTATDQTGNNLASSTPVSSVSNTDASSSTVSDTLSNTITAALASLTAGNNQTYNNNGTLLFDSLAGLISPSGTTGLSGNFSVTGGTTHFDFNSSQPPIPSAPIIPVGTILTGSTPVNPVAITNQNSAPLSQMVYPPVPGGAGGYSLASSDQSFFANFQAGGQQQEAAPGAR